MGALIRPMLLMYSWRIDFARWILTDAFLPTGTEISYQIDGRIRYCAVEFFAAECNMLVSKLTGAILIDPAVKKSSYRTLA